MSIFWSKVDTYQDVKANLSKYTLYLLIIGSFLFTFFNPRFSILEKTFWANYSNIIVFVPGGFSFLLIYFFEFHDKVYDRYLIQWRKRYDLRFILPKLVRPYRCKIDRDFIDVAQDNRDEFMKHLFYPFVGDREPEKTIGKNFKVRFYESILKYWITQINEVIILFWIIFVFVYYFFSQPIFNHEAPTNYLILNLLFLIIAFITNKAIRNYWIMPQVKKKTSDEIEEIHKNHSEGLEEEIEYINSEFDLCYGKEEN